MNILIHNAELAVRNHLTACIEWVNEFYVDQDNPALTPRIYCNERDDSGWIEYCIILPYVHGGQASAMAIQREHGAEVEFHS